MKRYFKPALALAVSQIDLQSNFDWKCFSFYDKDLEKCVLHSCFLAKTNNFSYQPQEVMRAVQ